MEHQPTAMRRQKQTVGSRPENRVIRNQCHSATSVAGLMNETSCCSRERTVAASIALIGFGIDCLPKIGRAR